MAANPPSAWYDFFMADSSHDWILNLAFGLRAIWSTIFTLFNVGLIYVTVKNKDLHLVCNILIAFEAFFAIFLNLNFYVSFFVAAVGWKFIHYEKCFPLIVLPAVFSEMAQLTMLLIGIDRLFSVLFPFWYTAKSKKWCLGVASLLLSLYAIYVSILLYVDFTQTKQIMVSCSINEMVQSEVGFIIKCNTITISVLLMAIYILVWVISNMFKTAATLSESSKHLLKSLIIIIGLDLSCVCFRNVTMLSLKMFPISALITNGLSVLFSFMTITIYSANGPVLYVISTVYRKKFKKHFKMLRTAGGAKVSCSNVVPIQMQQIGIESRKSFSRMIDVVM